MGRLSTMMLFLLLSGFVTSVVGIKTITLRGMTNLSLFEDDYIIQSLYFPDEYINGDDVGNNGHVVLNAPSEVGAGYYLFFTEFMTSENDVLTISHENITHILCGPEFTKRGTAAYIYTEGSVVFQPEEKFLPTEGHTGFQIIVKRHGADEIVGTSYNDTTNLDAMGYTYFFVSPAYPATNGSTIERTQTFTSDNSIRVLLYDFNFIGTVTLYGKDANGTETTEKYT